MFRGFAVPAILSTAMFVIATVSHAQKSPPASDRVWHSKEESGLSKELAAEPDAQYPVDRQKRYTLAELIDLAQQHNPETHSAWETAKARAASLGIARSALFPTLEAVALAQTTRLPALLVDWHRQTEGLFFATLHVDYLVFDLGGRSGVIDEAKANLLIADLAFNDTHRKVIFDVAASYYKLLNAIGQREAAEVSLKNAQTVEEDAQNRLANGLATKPDVLEATAARAQADFDLQAAVGAEDIAHGQLATVLGLSPQTVFQVQGIDELPTPSAITDTVDQEIDRAFAHRPELLEQIARIRAANAAIKQARSTFFPSLRFTGDGGLGRGYGQQDLVPGTYAESEIWNVTLGLRWTLFDGTRREHEIAQAQAEKRAARADIGTLRDRIANEVWDSYVDMKTALRQQQAATALLTSADQSYQAARESYQYGVRNLLDVVQAQKALAQAQSEDVYARTQLLFQIANVSFNTGDLIATQPPRINP
jgi:outer membrane protein